MTTLSNGDKVGIVLYKNTMKIFIEEHEDGIPDHWIEVLEYIINPRISCVIRIQFEKM